LIASAADFPLPGPQLCRDQPGRPGAAAP